MNKQQALEKLAQLEAETKALRAIIEAPEPAGSLLPNVKKDGYWTPTVDHLDGLWFNEPNQRDDYMKAFETLLDLRRQPGSEVPKNGVNQWIIDGNVLPDKYVTGRAKTMFIYPVFETEEQVWTAIKTVGEERILHMFNTLHGVK